MLLDPSVANFRGESSLNLGDVIIRRAITRELGALFGPGQSFISQTTHQPYGEEQYRLANGCSVRFVAGTNLLSSKKIKYTWYRQEHRFNWLFPRLKPVVLFGVGWGVGYPDWKDWRIKLFYHRNLHRRHLHSVRDSFSAQMLGAIGIKNVLQTSCPTLWPLEGFVSNPAQSPGDCLFTLTDYRRVPQRDDVLLQTLLRIFPGWLHFFPQGAKDVEYLESLPAYASHRERFALLPRAVDELERFLQLNEHVIYVGTRLHGGVFAMQHGIKSLILAVDHRATEIAKDVGIPILTDSFASGIERWLEGSLAFGPIRLPLANIRKWRDYWSEFASRVG